MNIKSQSNLQKYLVINSKYWKVCEDDSSEVQESIETFGLPKIIFRGDKNSRLNLIHTHRKAVLVWLLKQNDQDSLTVECILFKNKSVVLHSKLIEDAMAFAQLSWPNCKLIVHIDQKRIASDTGKSFEVVDWTYSGVDEKARKIFEFPGLH